MSAVFRVLFFEIYPVVDSLTLTYTRRRWLTNTHLTFTTLHIIIIVFFFFCFFVVCRGRQFFCLFLVLKVNLLGSQRGTFVLECVYLCINIQASYPPTYLPTNQPTHQTNQHPLNRPPTICRQTKQQQQQKTPNQPTL